MLTLSGLLRCLRCGTVVVQRVLNPVVFRVCWALLFVVNDVVYSMSWAWINVGFFSGGVLLGILGRLVESLLASLVPPCVDVFPLVEWSPGFKREWSVPISHQLL